MSVLLDSTVMPGGRVAFVIVSTSNLEIEGRFVCADCRAMFDLVECSDPIEHLPFELRSTFVMRVHAHADMKYAVEQMRGIGFQTFDGSFEIITDQGEIIGNDQAMWDENGEHKDNCRCIACV